MLVLIVQFVINQLNEDYYYSDQSDILFAIAQATLLW